MAERFRMDESDEAAKTVRAFGDRNSALNELRSAKMDEAAMRVQNLAAKTEAEQAAAAHDLEVGNWESHAQRQRNMSELAVQRARVEDEQRYWASRPTYAADPVAALLEAKRSEPATIAWLKAHPLDAAVLATNSDPTRVAQIQSSHAGAVAAGYAPGSSEYFRHIDRALGSSSGTRGGGGGASGGGAEVRLTKGEVTAATDGSVCWGREGGAKCGQPVGIEEYARRKATMRQHGTWYDRLD
jgi:hypothetical protein